MTDDDVNSEFRRISAERRVLRLEQTIMEQRERIERLEFLLESARGQASNLIAQNKRLRAEVRNK